MKKNKKRLSELISELDTIYRDVLYLKYQICMSSSEISKLLGVSEKCRKCQTLSGKKDIAENKE